MYNRYILFSMCAFPNSHHYSRHHKKLLPNIMQLSLYKQKHIYLLSSKTGTTQSVINYCI